jgi:flagellar biosynthetic protein FliQ
MIAGEAQLAEALYLAFALALPVVALAAVVGLFVASMQAATQIQDVTVSHLPRLVVVVVLLALLGPTMGQRIATYAQRAFESAGSP